MNSNQFIKLFFIVLMLSCKPTITKNIEKIKIGMDKNEVLAIMGTPISIGATINENGYKIINYTYPNTLFSASGNVIYLDSSMHVIDISTLYN